MIFALMKGVIFDMDGVLCDSEAFICEAAVRMFKKAHGVSVKEADFIPFVGTGENRYLGGVAEKYGITLNLERDKKVTYDIYLELIHGRLRPLPGVHEFMTLCRKKNLKLAIASSADAVKVHGNLREIGLPIDRFDACVNAHDVERRKPHPDLFLLAARRMDLVARECLVVEDAVNGIRAGKAAGAKCLGLTTSFKAEELMAAGADWTAPDLAHVPSAILEKA